MDEAPVPLQSALRQLQLGVRRLCGAWNRSYKVSASFDEEPIKSQKLSHGRGRSPVLSGKYGPVVPRFLIWIAASLCFGASVYAQDGPVSSKGSADLEFIQFGDIVQIDVAGVRDYDWRGTITPEGFLGGYDISGDSLFALCKTPAEVSQDIAALLTKLVRDPKVTVSIIDSSGRPTVVLTGAVRTPQRFQLRRQTTLRELIVLSGGLTDRASGAIQVFRPGKIGCSAIREDSIKESQKVRGSGEFLDISVVDIISGKSGSDLKILSGDIVTVSEALPVFVTGGVAAPGRISTNSEITVSRAVAAAGGLTKSSDPRSVRIFRRKSGVGSVIDIDLEKIRAGSEPDVALRAFDVVEVGERGGKKNQAPPFFNSEGERSKSPSGLPLRVVE